MGQKSKQKGGGFERQIAKRLSLWLSHGDRDDLMWRSSMSGGRATVQSKKGNQNLSQAGDLSGIDKQGHEFLDKFTIEAKHYKDIYIGDIVWGLRKGDAIGKFWNQACDDAENAGKYPILIAKQNFYSEIIALPQPIMKTMQQGKNFYPAHADILPASITRLDYFLDQVAPEELINYDK